MSFFAGTHILSTLEPILLGVGLFAFLARKGHSASPAFGAYLACRLSVYVGLSFLLHAVRTGSIEKHLAYSAYYYIYWVGYLAGTVAAFLVIQEVFGQLMNTSRRYRDFGTMAFRWVTFISLMVACVLSIYTWGLHQNLLVAATSGLMKCMCILELCLLAFIVLFMQRLQVSLRSRSFGIALGLGLTACVELFGAAFAFGHPSMASLANYVSQIAMTVAAGVWAIYFIVPEPNREAVQVKDSSALAKWKEIATALDESAAPQIALSASSDFFLQDVEKAVDRVLEKNSMRPAS